jgi:hypothetical protein
MVTLPTGSVVSGRRWVDADQLICPGCGEQVRCAPPTTEPDDGESAKSLPIFSHRDTTALCHGIDGWPVEPVEARCRRRR